MKKFLSMIMMMSLLALPLTAVAHERDYRWGVDANRHSPYYNPYNRRHEYDRDHTGTAVAIGLGALFLGAIIAGNNRDDRRYESRTICQDAYVYDEYGRIIYDYYGNPRVTRQCWQQ